MLVIRVICTIPARYFILYCTSFNRWCTRITLSLCQSMHGPVIRDVRSFTVRMYYGSPNSYFKSFRSVRGLCAPRTCVTFFIPFLCGLPLGGLCFESSVPVVFGDGSGIVITYFYVA